jgi:hypothetical protein
VVQVRRTVATVRITGLLDTLEAYDVRGLRAVARDAAGEIIPETPLVCWGQNDWGQFGVGNIASPTAPVVAAGGRQFRAAMASSSATCGVTMNGTAYCWGGDGTGETGDGGRTAYGNVDKTTPSRWRAACPSRR